MKHGVTESGGTPAALLPARWRTRADELRKWAAAESAATALEQAARELDEALRSRDEEPLTLTEAAAESGYNAESIGRLIRRKKIPNAGRPNAPRVRRGDLPLKSGLSSPKAKGNLSRAEIARAVANRFGGGQ